MMDTIESCLIYVIIHNLCAVIFFMELYREIIKPFSISGQKCVQYCQFYSIAIIKSKLILQLYQQFCVYYRLQSQIYERQFFFIIYCSKHVISNYNNAHNHSLLPQFKSFQPNVFRDTIKKSLSAMSICSTNWNFFPPKCFLSSKWSHIAKFGE